MNADHLKELFAPLAAVDIKPMFGGYAVYAHGLCFAIETGGEAFLKVDGETEAVFSAAGSSPFIYQAKGNPRPTSFWRLPAEAYDDPDALRRWAALGLEAARRKAAVKATARDPSRPRPAAKRAPRTTET